MNTATHTYFTKKLFNTIALCAIATSLFLAATTIWNFQAGFDGDEAAHGVAALEITHALKTFSLTEMIDALTNDAAYPPVNDILLGVSYSIFGASLTSSRLTSLFFLFLTTLSIYLITKKVTSLTISSNTKIKTDIPHNAGMLAALLVATSPALLFNCSLTMLEPIGLLLTTLTIAPFCLVDKEKRYSIKNIFLLGLLVSAVGLTKYTMAMTMVPALFMTILIDKMVEP